MNNNNEQQPIAVTKELDSKNKNSNIYNLWHLLFPILISQGQSVQIEGWGIVYTSWGPRPLNKNWGRGRQIQIWVVGDGRAEVRGWEIQIPLFYKVLLFGK